MQQRWLSGEEIAAQLGVNRDTIFKWLVRNKMPAHTVGAACGVCCLRGGHLGQGGKSGTGTD